MTRAVLPTLLLATCLTVFFPRAGYAQVREGFWFGAGGGYGSAHASCDACDHSGRESSGVLYLKAGWTLTPRLLLGGELNTWAKDAMEIAPSVTTALRISSLTAIATFYPRASTRLFIKGGVGAALLDAEFTVAQTAIAPGLGSGLGLVSGAGYDIALTERVSVTPAVNFWFGRIGDLEFERQLFVGEWKQNVIDVTIGVTFH